MTVQPVLSLQNISKSFGNVSATSRVDFTLMKGEIHALLGENGAGKSTLMNIISGLCRPDEGVIRVHSRTVRITSPGQAIALGIGMVYQHFMVVPGFTSLENIILGQEPCKGIAIDFAAARKKLAALSAEYGLSIDPDTVTADLPVGGRQQVEILKALWREVSILILDEPTAVLGPQEVTDLFAALRKLVGRGISIVLITHKLQEVMQVADRVTILKRGQVTGTLPVSATSSEELAQKMVGRRIDLARRRPRSVFGREAFEAREVTVTNAEGRTVVDRVSFSIREGEIVGIAGIQGNGQAELAEAIAGLRKLNSGTIRLREKVMPMGNPRSMRENGFAHIPEDRQKHGLVLPFSIAENLVLCSYYQQPFAGWGIRNRRKIRQNAQILTARFDIRGGGPRAAVQTLSGGNQQKVVLARELSRDIVFLLANQPTRGLDIGSIEFVHQNLLTLADQGKAVLLISSELEEIFRLADTILVMHAGRIVARRTPDTATMTEVGLLMTRGAV